MPSPALKKILVFEDERPLSKALELKLKFSGFSVKCAFNGQEGLNILKEENFDLILLDLMMPFIDGFGVLRELQKMKIQTPVIVLSNLGQKEDIEKVKALGAVDFFVKSNTPLADIVEYVNKYL